MKAVDTRKGRSCQAHSILVQRLSPCLIDQMHTQSKKTDSRSVHDTNFLWRHFWPVLLTHWHVSLRLRGSGYFYNILTARDWPYIYWFIYCLYICLWCIIYISLFFPWADTLTFMPFRQERLLQGHIQISTAMSREYKMCSRALTLLCVCVCVCAQEVSLVWPWFLLFLVFSLSHTNTVTHSVTT